MKCNRKINIWKAAILKKTIREAKEETLHGISRDKLLKVMEPEVPVVGGVGLGRRWEGLF